MRTGAIQYQNCKSFWILTPQKKWEITMVQTWTVRYPKLQPGHHHQKSNSQFFYSLDAIPAAQPTVSNQWQYQLHTNIN